MPDDGAGGFVLRDGQSHGITIPADGAGGPPVFAFVRKGFLDAGMVPSTLSGDEHPVQTGAQPSFLTHMR